MVLETVGSSKSNSIRSLLIKAWRERWTDMQWGIHIKTVLPRYISGDIYHLSDCILQQALMGPLPNQLILSYLRHSLAAHIVSYGGVIDTISKYESFHKPHCVRAMLDLLSNMVQKVTCRGKPEDCVALALSLVASVKWFLRVILFSIKEVLSIDHRVNLKAAVELLYQYTQSQFLMGLIRIARLEDPTLWEQIHDLTKELEKQVHNIDSFSDKRESVMKILFELRDSNMSRCNEKIRIYNSSANSICYGLHTRVMVEALIHSGQSSQYLAHQLLLYKELRNMTEADLYLELLSCCFLGLGSDEKFPHQEFHWVGFSFMKVPAVIKLIHSNICGSSTNNPSDELLFSLKQLVKRTSLLDAVDGNMHCNCLEILLRELKAHSGFILLDHDIAAILKIRMEDPMAICIGPTVGNESTSSIVPNPNLIINAEPTVITILKTPTNKNHDSMLTVMNLLVSDKSRDVLLTTAAASGKLISYAQKFVKVNEQSLEPQPGENELMATNRALMFDITFLLLCHITQVYGVEVVLGEEEDTFIEKWMRHNMPDKYHSKIHFPESNSDSFVLSEIMQQVCSPDLNSKYGKVQWDKVCRNAPGLMKKLKYEVLSGTVTVPAAIEVLDKMCGYTCALPICFAAWICSTTTDENSKMNAIIDHLQHKICMKEPAMTIGYFEDRSQLMKEIISNMVKNSKDWGTLSSKKESCNYNIFNCLLNRETEKSPNLSSFSESKTEDLLNIFKETWNEIYEESGILTHSSLSALQKLIKLDGYESFVYTLVKLGMEYVFEADLNKAMDIIYGIFQIDLHRCCVHLLTTCLPKYLVDPDYSYLHSYQRICALAKLTVEILVAAWAEASVINSNPCITSMSSSNSSHKRSYSVMKDVFLEEAQIQSSYVHCSNQSFIRNINAHTDALLIAVQQFFNTLNEAAPNGVMNPVNDFIVRLLQEMVSAPCIISPLLTLLPANMLTCYLTLYPSDTFTPTQLLGLALPTSSPLLQVTASQEAAARRSAAKLLCIHRNLVLADASMDAEGEI